MSAFKRGGLASVGGHGHANLQQRRQPERQLVGRNELDDGCGSDRTGHIVAIPLVTGTRHLLSSVAAEQRMAFSLSKQRTPPHQNADAPAPKRLR